MDAADATAGPDLQRRIAEIHEHEHEHVSRAALSGRDLAVYALVTLGITLLGFLVLAL